MLTRLKNKWVIGILAVVVALSMAGGAVAQSNLATLSLLNNYLLPNKIGAGMVVDCGGDYPGIRGDYLCSIAQSGNTITVTRQVADASQDSGVRDETFTFSLAGGQADGVVTAGAFSANNQMLNLTVTAGGTSSTVVIDVPAAIRAGASLSDTTPQVVVTGTGAAGSSTDVSRADHRHGGDSLRSFGSHTPQAVAETGSVGSNSTVSRSDHAHAGRAFRSSAPENVTTGSGSEGTATTLSRSDHVHGGDSDTQRAYGTSEPEDVVSGSGSAGSAATVSRSDHVHGGDTSSAVSLSSNTPANVLSGTGTAGSATSASRSDHAHGGDRQRSFGSGTPGDVVTGTGSAGTNTSVSRFDHTHGGDRQRTISSSTPENVIAGTGSAGTSTSVSRSDHVHGGASAGAGDITAVTAGDGLNGGGTSGDVTLSIEYGSSTPEASTTAAGDAGSATSVSRSDHRHQAPGGGGGTGTAYATGSGFPGSPSNDDLFEFNAAVATITDAVDYNGTTAITSAVRGDVFKYNDTNSNWVKQSPGIVYSTAEPAETLSTNGAAGSGAAVAHANHRHELADNTVTVSNMAANSVDSDQYVDGSIDAAHLASAVSGRLLPTAGTTLTLPSSGNTTVLQINGGTLDSAAVMRIDVGSTGGMKAFQAGRTGEGLAWASFEGGIGGDSTMPGIAFGPGTSARDVNIYRGGSNTLKTDDNFEARSLDVEAVGALATRMNLGIVDYSTGTTFPTTPADDDIFEFNAAATSLTNTFDYDGTSAITEAARGDVFKYDSGNTRWVKQSESGTGGGGTTTFTGLTDTPANYTGSGGEVVRVNQAATALEFFAEPTNQNTIPHVGRIPAVTNTSPDLIFLTHDEVGGNREDADFTIARDGGNSCGYSDGSVYSPAFGTIDEPSPITSIFGIWNATDSNCDLSEVFSTNEGWLDDQAMIVGTVSGTAFSCNLGVRYQRNGQFVKRITSCSALEDLALGDITINFLDSSNPAVAYWNDGEIRNPAGLYEKVGTPPAYHDIRPIEESHRQGQGSFACGDTEPPDDGGQVCIDSDGRASFSTDRTLLIDTPAAITANTEFMSDYWLGADTNIIGFNNTAENGEFKWFTTGDVFFQIQGTRATGVITVSGTQNTVIPLGVLFDRDGVSVTRLRTTAAATIPAGGSVNIPVEAVSPGATGNSIPTSATFTLEDAITGVDDSATVQTAFSGGSGTGLVTPDWDEIWTWIAGIDDGDTAQEQATHNALATNSIFLGEFSQESDAAEDRDGYTDTTTRYFYLIHGDEDDILEITGFTASVNEERDDHRWVGPVVTIEDVHDIFEANSEEPITGVLDDFRIGDNVYSVIVRPDSDGILRDPTEADFDTDFARSKSVAVVDGVPYKVRRLLVDGHSATGTFTQVTEGTRLTAGGSGTYRFRGIFHGDSFVQHPEEDDIYYNLDNHSWRVRDHDPVYGNYWYTLPNGGEILTRLGWVGFVTSEDDALSHASANGQRFIYPVGGGYGLFTLSGFTAAAANHYTYEWTPSVPPAVAPPNVTLVDDLSVTFNAAHRPSIEVKFSQELTQADDGRPVIIDYRPNAAGSNSRAASASIFAEHIRNLANLRPVALQKTDGGRTPIDHTVDLPTAANRGPAGNVEFPFPLSSGNNDLRWMRLYYIGDHIDDVDGSFGLTATTITLNNSAGILTDTVYWMVGPVTGAGCPVDYHSEKVRVTAVGTPNPHDITIVRGIDGTALDNIQCVQFATAADFILDDKRTFVLAGTNDDQDSGDFTFTLLGQGVGAASSTGGGGEGTVTGIDAGTGIAVIDNDTATPEVSVDLAAVAATHATPTRADRMLVETGGTESISTIGQIFGAMQTPRIYTSGVTYGGTNNAEITIADTGYTPAVGDMILFQHNTGTDANYSATNTIRISVGSEGLIRTRISDVSDGALRDIRLDDLSRYEWMAFLRAGSFWHLMFRTYITP